MKSFSSSSLLCIFCRRWLCTILCLCLLFPLTGSLFSCSASPDTPEGDEHPASDTDPHLSSLIFRQVFGAGKQPDAAVGHSYIQLFNTSLEPVSLRGASLYVRRGDDSFYTEFPLPSHATIPGRHAYLIRCAPAGGKDGLPYNEEKAVFRLDAFDLSLEKLRLDQRENTVLLAASGRSIPMAVSPEVLPDIAALFVGTGEETDTLCPAYLAADMSKNKVAIKIDDRPDTPYAVRNLTQAGTADLLAWRPETTKGDVNTYTRSRLSEVIFSQYAGFYDEVFSLSLDAPAGYTIYYTTDGSTPTTSSPVYHEPILLDDTSSQTWGPEIKRGIRYLGDGAQPTAATLPGAHIIKAMASNGTEQTAVFTNTYFIIPGFSERYRTTVFSLSLPERDWISAEGFYNRYAASDPRPRANAYVEVFEPSGDRVGHSHIEIAVSGKYSATKLMKSLRLYFKKSLNDGGEGQNRLTWNLFGSYAVDNNGAPVAEFERLLLRNGGNDCGLSYIRDAFSQRLGALCGVDAMAYTPVLVFVNGEFWGMYNCRERYERQYFTEHYGVAKENVTVMESDYSLVNRDNLADYVVSDGDPADGADFNQLYHTIAASDLKDPEQYAYVCSRLDIDSVINMYVEHLIFGAADWPHNNIKLWRNSNPEDPSGMDTKWHYALLDQDTTLGLARPYHTSGFSEAFNHDSVTALIASKLMENDDFRDRFYLRYYEAVTEIYTVERMTELFWEVYDSVRPLMTLQQKRWPGDGASVDTWEKQMWTILSYLQNRPAYVLENFYRFFHISEDTILALRQGVSAASEQEPS